MDRKSKIFFIVLGLLIAGSVAVTYWRIMVKKDYVIESQVDCDPTVDKCFIWECDPASDVEGEKCTGDPDNDIWYYQIARRNASRIPLCDPDKDDNCKPMECDPATEKDCSVTFCDEITKVAQKVECSDPVKYNEENPPEADASDASTTDSEASASAEAPATDSTAPAQLPIAKEGAKPAPKN